MSITSKKFRVYVFGENPSGFWHKIQRFNTLKEARVWAEQEKQDNEVYEIYIRRPGGEKKYIIGES